MRSKIKHITILSIILLLWSGKTFAQKDNPPPPDYDTFAQTPPPPPPPGLPIDDYLPLLGIAGIAYGVHVRRKFQKA